MSDVGRFSIPAGSAAGGHVLPPRLGHLAAPARHRRRRIPIGAVLGLVGAVIVGAAFAGTQLAANLRFDDAEEMHEAARADALDTRSSLQQEVDALTSTITSADALITGNTGILMDSVPLTDVETAIAEADETTASATDLTTTAVPQSEEKPGWFWELFGTAEHLDAQTRAADDLNDDMGSMTQDVSDADARLVAAGSTAIVSAAAAVPAFEAAHISAKNLDIIAMRTAAEDIATLSTLDDDAVTRFTALQAAAAQVVASQDAELAEKAGPLLGARLEIEAFARSLAPGVLLEFDWAPIVNGVGTNGSMGGYTTWWWDEPDRSVILLSNSVAEQWPAERSKALVAHEVGHAISVKCEDMYDSSTQDSIEKWATAWAISMGFTDDANGVWAYGYPPESYIAAAGGCR